MIKLNDILNKINTIELDVTDISNIITIEFYTDYSGSIHSTDHEYFCFECLNDLQNFMKLDNDYIIRNRKVYPIYG